MAFFLYRNAAGSYFIKSNQACLNNYATKRITRNVTEICKILNVNVM